MDAYTAWREQLQEALVCALDEVQVTFACIGHPSGTTVTILIQVSFNGPKTGHKETLTWVQRKKVGWAAAALAVSVYCIAVSWRADAHFSRDQ